MIWTQSSLPVPMIDILVILRNNYRIKEHEREGFMLERVRLIVLKSMPFSESDLIIKGLNENGTQMSFIAKGALKSKKRFTGGVLEPTSFIEVEYRHARNSLHKLKQAWFVKTFLGLRKDYDRLELAFYFLKVVGDISQEGTNDSKELFHLLGNAFIQAEKTDSLDNLKLFFQIKILFLQGVLPQNLFYSSIVSCTLEDHHDLQIESKDRQTLFQEVNQTLNHYLVV